MQLCMYVENCHSLVSFVILCPLTLVELKEIILFRNALLNFCTEAPVKLTLKKAKCDRINVNYSVAMIRDQFTFRAVAELES